MRHPVQVAASLQGREKGIRKNHHLLGFSDLEALSPKKPCLQTRNSRRIC
jgi:hypothetical protein